MCGGTHREHQVKKGVRWTCNACNRTEIVVRSIDQVLDRQGTSEPSALCFQPEKVVGRGPESTEH